MAEHPDWGPIQKSTGPNGEELVNLAGTLEILRFGDTAKSQAAYAAVCEIWEMVKEYPGLSEREKQKLALQAALQTAVGTKITFKSIHN